MKPRFSKTYKIQRKKYVQLLFNLEEGAIELRRNLMVRDGSTCAGESSGIRVRVVSHQKTDESGGVSKGFVHKENGRDMHAGKSET